MAAGKIIRKVVFGLTAALLVAIPAVGTPIYKQNEAAIKGFLLKQALADGMVLLKNENNALPLKSSEKTLNVLGYHSVAWLHGGSGSGMVSKSTADTGFADILSSLRGYGVTLNEDILSYYRSIHDAGANPNIDTLNFHRQSDGHRFDLYDPAISGEYQNKLNAAVSFSDTALGNIKPAIRSTLPVMTCKSRKRKKPFLDSLVRISKRPSSSSIPPTPSKWIS